MSIAEFSAALRNKAIKEWFDKEKSGGGSASKTLRDQYKVTNVNTLVNPTSDYRSAEQTATKTSFIITKDTISQLLIDFKGYAPGSSELQDATNYTFSLFKRKNEGVVVNRRKITVGNGVPAVYFSSISFQSITDLVNNILKLQPRELAAKYEKGHVIGLNTELLQVTTDRIVSIDTRGSQGKALLISELNKVIEYYKRLDYASANIQPASSVRVYASVNKSIDKEGRTKYLVELQPKAANQRSADEVKATIGSIRKLFSPNNLSNEAMEQLIDKLRASVSDPKFQQDLLNLKSSPSLLGMIEGLILNTLSNKPISKQEYNIGSTLVAEKSLPKVNLYNIRKIATEEKVKIEKLVSKLKTKVPPIPPIRTTQGQFYSLANLQVLINTHLQDVVSANMGNEPYPGGQRRILNYRTGRFAASASVVRMSASREGMITAFYSYMKNPYQTFEPGHPQGKPLTRDPKLLIGTSIKEIAATKVGNRLRAVLV